MKSHPNKDYYYFFILLLLLFFIYLVYTCDKDIHNDRSSIHHTSSR